MLDRNSGSSEAPSESPDAKAPRSLRQRVYEVIEPGYGENRASDIFNGVIVALIIINILAIILETVPELRERYRSWFLLIEIVTVAAFTVEYALRLWTAVEVPYLRKMQGWKARLSYALSPALLIDLMAILPFYLQLIVLEDLSVLRMLRLLRFLKLSRYSPAIHTLIRVLKNERKALIGAGLLLLMALLFSSTLMYNAERAVQPDKFGSIPQTMWWSITTLTTVGYGDATPVTAMGRLIGGLTMILGLCILALPVAIISTGFAQEVHRRDFVVNWSLMSRVPALAQLDAKEATEIMSLLHAHILPPNVEIAQKGSTADAIYFVASGRVDQIGETDTTSYRTGDIFGAGQMLNNEGYPGNVFTFAKSRLLKLHREDFDRIQARHPNLAEYIREAAARGS